MSMNIPQTGAVGPAPIAAPAPTPLARRIADQGQAFEEGAGPGRDSAEEAGEQLLDVVNAPGWLPLGLPAVIGDGAAGTRPGQLMLLSVHAPCVSLPQNVAGTAAAAPAAQRAGAGPWGAAATPTLTPTPTPTLPTATDAAPLPQGASATATNGISAALAGRAPPAIALAATAPRDRQAALPEALPPAKGIPARFSAQPAGMIPAREAGQTPMEIPERPLRNGDARAASTAKQEPALAVSAPLLGEVTDPRPAAVPAEGGNVPTQAAQRTARAMQQAQSMRQAHADRAAASELHVAFTSWGAGHGVTARMEAGRWLLLPTSGRVERVLAEAVAVDNGDLRLAASGVRDATDDHDPRRRRRRGHDA